MRAVFLGQDTTILDALSACCEVVGVYVALPRAPLRAIRDWPMRHYAVRRRMRQWVDRYPSRFRSWRRRLMHFQIADYAHVRGFPALAAPSVNSTRFFRQLTELKPDIGVIANFGEILRGPVLHVPTFGFVNFHPSPLPRYRGPTPLPHMVLNGETRGAVTWHQVSATIDGGDVLAQEAFDIASSDTVSALTVRSVRLAAEMLPALLRSIEQGACRPVPQDSSCASYFPKLSVSQKERVKLLERERQPRPEPEAA